MHVAHNSPGAHERKQVHCERLLARVPEGVNKCLVVPNCYRYNRASELKRALLEHDTKFVVHAGALREDERGVVAWVGHVCPKSIGDFLLVLGVFAIEFDASKSVKHMPLEQADPAGVRLHDDSTGDALRENGEVNHGGVVGNKHLVAPGRGSGPFVANNASPGSNKAGGEELDEGGFNAAFGRS